MIKQKQQQYMKETSKKDKKVLTTGFSLIKIGSDITPIFGQRAGNNYYLYGDNNNYPDYLIELFDSSPIHQSIINLKARLTMGKGLRFSDKLKGNQKTIAEEFLAKANTDNEDADSVMEKIIYDRLIFNGYTAFVANDIQNKKFRSIYHMPFNAFRKEVKEEGLIFSDFWAYDKFGKPVMGGYLPRERRYYDAYEVNKKSGILWKGRYSPGFRIYPKPEYISAITSIETDAEINRFHCNNVKTGFAAGYAIEFIGIDPTPQEKSILEAEISEKFTGSLNAGEIMIFYSPTLDRSIKIHPMRPNELDKQYIETAKKVMQDILIAHNVPNPAMIGIETPGKLAGSSEGGEAMKEFMEKSIKPLQKEMSDILNDLFYDSHGFEPGFYFEELGSADEQTDNEIETDKELDTNVKKDAEQFKDEKKSIDGIIERLGQCGVLESDVKIIRTIDLLQDPTEELEYELISSTITEGFSFSGFEIMLFDYIQKNKGLTMLELSKRFGANPFIVQTALNKLSEGNAMQYRIGEKGQLIVNRFSPLNVSGAGDSAVQEQKSGTELVTMYRYSGPNDSRTRPFCSEMMNRYADRLWTREEIADISADEGRSVWLEGGGWYTIPNSGTPPIRRPKCRHIWQAVVVERKIS
jgi:hypothetical protein